MRQELRNGLLNRKLKIEMVWVHCAVEKHTSLGKIALEALALEHETDGELDDKMMILVI